MARQMERGNSELAVVLAYTKNSLTAAVLASDLPESPAFAGDLFAYVPPAVRDRFAEHVLA